MVVTREYIDVLIATNRVGKLIKLIKENIFEWSVNMYEYIYKTTHNLFFRVWYYFIYHYQNKHLIVLDVKQIISNVNIINHYISIRKDKDITERLKIYDFNDNNIHIRHILSKEVRYDKDIYHYITPHNSLHIICDDNIFRKISMFVDMTNIHNKEKLYYIWTN